MKISKYIIGTFIIGALSLGGLVSGNANEKFTTVDSKEVLQAYNDLLNQDGVEHVILTESNGTTLDLYRDRSTGSERVDYYDENNMLIDRKISTDYGATFLTLSQYKDENDEWKLELMKTLPPENAVVENKELIQKSIIDGFFEEEFISGVHRDWKKSNIDTKNNLIKYSDESNNIYINTSTGEVFKREILVDGKIVKTFDVEVLSTNKVKSIDIFKIDAPLLKSESIGDNKNIRNINKELQIDVEDYSDVEYDPTNAKG